MTSGVIKVGLVALVGTIIGVGVYGCKKSKDYYNRGVVRFKKGQSLAGMNMHSKREI
jgi:hypothetical protein